MHLVGRINRNIYECVTRNIRTDEVIITEERIEHIKEVPIYICVSDVSTV